MDMITMNHRLSYFINHVSCVMSHASLAMDDADVYEITNDKIK